MIGLLDFIIDGIRNVAKKLYHVIFIWILTNSLTKSIKRNIYKRDVFNRDINDLCENLIVTFLSLLISLTRL